MNVDARAQLAEIAALETAAVYRHSDRTRYQEHAIEAAGTGPATPAVIAALLDDVSVVRPVPGGGNVLPGARERRCIEQLIARGLDEREIAAAAVVPLADVRAVRAQMDELSA